MMGESLGSTGSYYNYRYGRWLMDSRQQQYVTEVFGRYGCRADDVCDGFTVSETSFIPYERFQRY